MPQRKPHKLFEVVLSPAIVMERVGMDEAGILAGVNTGTFPKPIKFDGRVVWRDTDISEWTAQRLAADDNAIFAQNSVSPALGQLAHLLAVKDAKDYLAELRDKARRKILKGTCAARSGNATPND